jgi:excisionase family DNA binding protein
MCHPTITHDRDEWIMPTPAAKILGVTAWTVNRWADTGKLPCRRLPDSGHRRYRRADVEALAEQMGSR